MFSCHNNDMSPQESLYLILPATIVFLLILPLAFEGRVSFNPEYNRGVFVIKFFKIKIMQYLFMFDGARLKLQKEDETKVIEMQFSGDKFTTIKLFILDMFDKLKLRKLLVFYNVGTGDSFSSAMLCGAINQILTQMFLFLKSKKPTSSLCVYDTVSYNKEVFEVALRIEIAISLFDVMTSFLHAYIVQKTQYQV